MPVKKLSLACILLQFFAATPLYCQNTDLLEISNIVHMSMIDLLNLQVVTASRHRQTIDEAPGVISVMTAEEIEQFGAVNLFEILNRMPNVISHIGHSIDSIAIRGRDLSFLSERIAFLLDGYPIRNGGGNGILICSLELLFKGQPILVITPRSKAYHKQGN
jgi:iron complex outermembrane receptor protein